MLTGADRAACSVLRHRVSPLRLREALAIFVSLVRSLFGTALVASLAVAPCSANAETTTLTLAGTNRWSTNGTHPPPTLDLSKLLSGKYYQGTIVPVIYPALTVGLVGGDIPRAAEKLRAVIETTHGDKRVVGVSQGSAVIAEAKRRLMAFADITQRPDPRHLAFVSVADPFRPKYGSLVNVLTHLAMDTPYDSTYITREYDGVADVPDRPNPVALANAAAGSLLLHPHYESMPEDIPAKNITTWTNAAGGTVTDILIPTRNLPMLQPMRDLGLDMDWLQAILKPQVDSGYSRNSQQDSDNPKALPTLRSSSLPTPSCAAGPRSRRLVDWRWRQCNIRLHRIGVRRW